VLVGQRRARFAAPKVSYAYRPGGPRGRSPPPDPPRPARRLRARRRLHTRVAGRTPGCESTQIQQQSVAVPTPSSAAREAAAVLRDTFPRRPVGRPGYAVWRSCARQSLRVEQRDGVVGGPIDGQVGKDLTDQRNEFEAVPGESARHDDVGALRVAHRSRSAGRVYWSTYRSQRAGTCPPAPATTRRPAP
jgi:hypothetical protein